MTAPRDRMPAMTDLADDSLFLEVQQALRGRYSLLAELGRGGMGVVYLAHEVALDRPVALKVLPPEYALLPGRRQRFLREARAAAQLSHPNIVPIYAVDDAGRFAWYAMAYIEGETLTQRVRDRGPLAESEAAALLRDIARALGYAHARGVVHRDVKPDNILLERATRRPLLSDFGIARLAEGASDTGTGVAIGTPEYMSPEQASGEPVDGRADLYALGAVAWFALAGRPPFVATEARALMAQHITEAPPPLSSLAVVSARLRRIVDRCLAKAPTERFEAGEALAEALDIALDKPRVLPAPLERWVHSVDQLRFRQVLMAPVLLWPTLTVLNWLIEDLGGSGGILTSGDPVFEWLRGASLERGSLIALLIFVAPFAVYAVHRLLALRRVRAAGFGLDDLRAALAAELRRQAEAPPAEAAAPRSLWQRAAGAAQGLTVALLGTLTLWRCYEPGEGEAWGLLIASWIALAGALMAARAARPGAEPPELLDLNARRRVWDGPLGRLVSWLTGLGLRRRAIAAVGTHRPTELALGGAAAALYEALPRTVRAQLPDVLEVIGDLEAQATRLREWMHELDGMRAQAGAGAGAARGGDAVLAQRRQLESELGAARQAAEAKLTGVVGALETIRLDLIRLRAGTVTVASIGEALDAARRVGAEIDAALAGREGAEGLLRPSPTPS